MNFADHYGTRVRGYLCPPTSGEYVFYLAADDFAELWLSTDADPVNKRRIAFTNRHTQPGQYDRFRSQTSEPITLVQGQRYYVEALHRELGGVDHLSVGWRLPDGALQRPIPGTHLIPFAAPMYMMTTAVGHSQGLGTGSGRLEAYPNPFSDQVSIDFTLPEAGRVSLQVFDVKGGLVETLFEGEAGAGSAHRYAFRAGDHRSGVYICRLSYGKQVIHKRLVVVR
ncbi:hypothetical protein BH24BAC1_BH24BAC1_19510 [soil metagenome]